MTGRNGASNRLPALFVAALVLILSACGSSDTTGTTHVATVTPEHHHAPVHHQRHHQPAQPPPKPKPKPKPPPPPSPSPKQAALAKTTKCLQSIPLLKVDTSGGSLADIEVSADVDTGGGNAFIAVFSSHAEAVKYSQSLNNGAVGNLAGAIFNYKGSQEFQTAVKGCLG